MRLYYRGTWLRFICTLIGHDNHDLDMGFPGKLQETMTLCLRCARATTQEKTP